MDCSLRPGFGLLGYKFSFDRRSLRWLGARAGNIDYLTTALELAPKDGFQLLTMAQYEAIKDCFEKVVACAAALLG